VAIILVDRDHICDVALGDAILSGMPASTANITAADIVVTYVK